VAGLLDAVVLLTALVVLNENTPPLQLFEGVMGEEELKEM